MDVMSVEGTIDRGQSIAGTIALDAVIGATVSSMSYKTYTGPYDVVPKEDVQTLATRNLLMSDDVNIKAIPTYRVANASGGDTFTIGELNG
jgi:hypothetical protein